MKKRFILLFVIIFCLSFMSATIINIPGDQPTIQAGINVAVDADTVLVQPGTYVENINYNGTNIIVASLFYTTQDTSYISQTIIDGNQSGSVVIFESGEDETAVLSGFTITNGSAISGGGVYCSGSSPNLENLKILNNSALDEGGGLYCLDSNLNICNSIISFNGISGDYGYGGGFFCENSDITINDVIITNNNSTRNGGGGYLDYSDANLDNVVISNNNALYGGGIYLSYSDANLENLIISDNIAGYAYGNGGGIYCSNSDPNLLNVTISNNIATGHQANGGGMKLGFSSPTLENVTITNNSVLGNITRGGGGIYCFLDSSPVFVNVTIADNNSTVGGGIYCGNNANPVFINSILWNDTPEEVYFRSDLNPNSITISYTDIQGDSLGIVTNNNGTVNWLEGNIDADPMFVDPINGDYHLTENSPCIDAGNPDPQYYDPDGTIADMGALYFETIILYANFIGNPTFGNMPLDVQFTDLSNGNILSWQWDFQNDGTIDSYEQNPIFTYGQQGVYSVKLIVEDATQTDTMIQVDYINVTADITIDGYAFLENQNIHSDIRVLFERTAPSSLIDSTFTYSSGYFNLDFEPGIFNITYSKDDYIPISLVEQELVSNTTLNDVTLLERSTIINVPVDFSSIQAAIDFANDADTVLVQPGTYLENINYNGKNITVASLFITTQDTSYISQTVIDGNQDGSVVTFENGEEFSAILSGFTITNGSSGSGGGIKCFTGTYPTLKYLIVTENYATSMGGGISCSRNPRIENVIISNNSSGLSGGGVYCWVNSTPVFENVMIINNTASGTIGGSGGGVGCFGSFDPPAVSPIFRNVTIINNSADTSGGGIYCQSYSSPILENVTIADNSAGSGGSISSTDNSVPTLINSILWNNSIPEISGIVDATYSDIQGGWAGEGNIDSDPLFVDPFNGNYHLSWANFPSPDSTMSPCIDAGDPSSPFDPDATIADMGAFYFDQSIVPVNEEIINNIVSTTIYQNYPNPFNPETTISYSLKDPGKVVIEIFNIKGQKVKQLVSGQQIAGRRSVVWNGKDDEGKPVSSGIYLYRMKTENKTLTRKMILVK